MEINIDLAQMLKPDFMAQFAQQEDLSHKKWVNVFYNVHGNLIVGKSRYGSRETAKTKADKIISDIKAGRCVGMIDKTTITAETLHLYSHHVQVPVDEENE
jgi:hypothetical protein